MEQQKACTGGGIKFRPGVTPPACNRWEIAPCDIAGPGAATEWPVPVGTISDDQGQPFAVVVPVGDGLGALSVLAALGTAITRVRIHKMPAALVIARAPLVVGALGGHPLVNGSPQTAPWVTGGAAPPVFARPRNRKS